MPLARQGEAVSIAMRRCARFACLLLIRLYTLHMSGVGMALKITDSSRCQSEPCPVRCLILPGGYPCLCCAPHGYAAKRQ